ncbi:MAG: hypothetical protein QOF12_2207 [Solirubrobacteraceae bacterium]|nr:hypothetical protein [Solirubrobacteraceae bacterium]
MSSRRSAEGWTQPPLALASVAPVENDIVKRLAWSALLAGFGAAASILTTRVAAVVYRRLFGEEPPE